MKYANFRKISLRETQEKSMLIFFVGFIVTGVLKTKTVQDPKTWKQRPPIFYTFFLVWY